ncbi:hypothetical protein HaLaN_20050 [Haematococcus lacustris]|uniref:Uncharacterized protein n=1 Tax=Haematococcus lacustris TaxID=44745 RepID=A0A699ZS67_HAELA|nr:hypothetical protein HaLaN_20050 [Haematococcus lacustris]
MPTSVARPSQAGWGRESAYCQVNPKIRNNEPLAKGMCVSKSYRWPGCAHGRLASPRLIEIAVLVKARGSSRPGGTHTRMDELKWAVARERHVS